MPTRTDTYLGERPATQMTRIEPSFYRVEPSRQTDGREQRTVEEVCAYIHAPSKKGSEQRAAEEVCLHAPSRKSSEQRAVEGVCLRAPSRKSVLSTTFALYTAPRGTGAS